MPNAPFRYECLAERRCMHPRPASDPHTWADDTNCQRVAWPHFTIGEETLQFHLIGQSNGLGSQDHGDAGEIHVVGSRQDQHHWLVICENNHDFSNLLAREMFSRRDILGRVRNGCWCSSKEICCSRRYCSNVSLQAIAHLLSLIHHMFPRTQGWRARYPTSRHQHALLPFGN